jgi:large subunit ribosomal protein L18
MARLDRHEQRRQRHRRIRRKVQGTPERPRLCVYKSLRYIYVQLVDDAGGHTLLAASTRDKRLNGQVGCNIASAKALGRLVSERAKAQGISRVVFDRGGYPYHGVVQALAESCREGGLEF